MALQKQLIAQPFVGGIDTKTDPKFVRHPSMLTMDNVTLEDSGRVQKRSGYVAQSATLEDAEALFEHKGQLLSTDGADLYRRADDTWKEVGACHSIKTTAELVNAGGSSHTYQCSAATSAFEVVAWYQDATIYYSSRDLTTNTWYTSKGTVASAATLINLKLVAVEDYVFLVAVYPANTDIYRWSSASSAVSVLTALTHPQLGGVGTLYSNSAVDWIAFNFGDAGITNGDWGLLGVMHETSSTSLVLYGIKQDGTQYGGGDNFNAGTFDLTTIEPGYPANSWPNTLYAYMPPQGGDPRIMYCGSGGVDDGYYIEIDISATDTALASTPINGLTNTGLFLYGFSPTGTLTGLKFVGLNQFVEVTSEAGALSADQFYGLVVVTQPFTLGYNRYIGVATTRTNQDTIYLMDCDSQKIVASVLPTAMGTLDQHHRWKPQVWGNFTKLTTPVSVYGEEWYYSFPYSTKFAVPFKESVNATKVGRNNSVIVFYNDATALLKFETDHVQRYMNAELGDNLHISGGFLQAYDGKQSYEHGFFVYPNGVLASDTGAGSLGAGTYSYKVVYEWTDVSGQTHVSAASPAVSCVTGASRQNTVTYPNYRFGNRTLTDVRIGIYRTQAGGTSVYYRVTTVSASPTNDPTASTSTYVDNITDAVIATHDTLYTVGGELDNDAPPSCQILISGKNRLWAVDEWGKLWYSKEYRPGEAVGFSLFLTKSVPQYGGPITALGVLDDKIIVFKEDRMFAFAGDGPTPDGQNDTFSLVSELPSKVGCTNPLSIVEYDDGLLFQSNKGIYLLDRSLNARYVGQGVDAYNSLTISAALALPDKNQVRFVTSDGVTLVYDYEQRDQTGVGLWSTFSNLESYDAVVWQDSVRLLRTNGEVWTETEGTFTDNGTYYRATVETGWFAPAGPQAWKRVYRVLLLGEKKSEHTLYVGLAYDYLDDNSQVVDFVTTDLVDTSYGEGIFGEVTPYGVGEGDIYQFRINPAKQECKAIKIKIWDDIQAGTGESFTLSDLTFEVGVKGQATKLSGGRSG